MSETLPPPLPPVDWVRPHDEPLAQLERQIVRGSQFAQASLQQLSSRLEDVEAYLTELVTTLQAGGVLAPEEEDGRDQEPDPIPEDGDPPEPLAENQGRIRWPGVAFRTDGDSDDPSVEVDCAARMPICHAVCCRLNFALTAPEVEAGRIKWDLGFPYFIRHEANGYCTHNDVATGCCTAYADRPEVCRRYSCAGDPRIWKDFDGMVLNEEWIQAHLSDPTRIVVRSRLPLMDAGG